MLKNGVVTSRRAFDQVFPSSSDSIKLMELPAHPPIETETKKTQVVPSSNRKPTGLPSFLMYLPRSIESDSRVAITCAGCHNSFLKLALYSFVY